MRHVFILYFIALSFFGHAGVDPSLDYPYANEYRSFNNPHYWQNRKPSKDYWQQDVHYQINAVIDDKVESITAKQRLSYINNSPDTLYEVYFHLYQNAFTPNSYAHDLRKSGKITTKFGEHEAKGIGTLIRKFSINGRLQAYELDNTILSAQLVQPLMPGEKLFFEIDFTTYWDKDDQGNMRRRMKSFEHDGVSHFDGVHWYPRIAVYDRKFGWTTDQHLGKEFYGDFGLYEVSLSFPNQYIVEATGSLQNREEALPDELREAIDLKNYKTQRSILTEPIKADGSRKLWRYKANNVHDFAFTADPSYRIGEVIIDGVRCIALAQEQNAHRWQPTAQFVAQVIQTYSRDFGKYIYPKMVAADARDGMEYPMITLNGGNWPGHQYVIAHEVGHNWFFGMLGNNETYRSALDEGFTQFLTAWSLKKINKSDNYGNQVDKGVVFNNYLSHAIGNNSATLNVHADHYNSAERHGGGYGQVYYKTASMLYNLQYVLGDSLFEGAMKHYVKKWKLCHPYWEDFKKSVIDYSHTDLNWFFDQWITTTKTIDYKVGKIRKTDFGKSIRIKRKGSMQMPLDIAIEYSDGSVEQHYIPNTYFEKKTTAVKHPRWIGWDAVQSSYDLNVQTDKKIRNVIIDPSERLADINRLNNSKKLAYDLKFKFLKPSFGNFYNYQMSWKPDLWYNAIDGLKLGLKWQGNYANLRHRANADIWFNTAILARETASKHPLISYRISYGDRLQPETDFQISSAWIDGLNRQSIEISRPLSRNQYFLRFNSLYRNADQALDYLIRPESWQASKWNNYLELGINRPLKGWRSRGTFLLSTRASALFSDFNYASIKAEWINRRSWKGTSLRSRVFAIHMTGNPAPESLVQLAGANNEELMSSPWLRSAGFVPESWESMGPSIGNWHHGGGLNLRGFTGYQATNSTEADTFFVFQGTQGASINLEWDFERKLDPFKRRMSRMFKLNSYLFSDMGVLANQRGNSGFRMDAGVGTALTIDHRRRTAYGPLVLRIDFPLFINRTPAGEGDFLAFRAIFGVARSF